MTARGDHHGEHIALSSEVWSHPKRSGMTSRGKVHGVRIALWRPQIERACTTPTVAANTLRSINRLNAGRVIDSRSTGVRQRCDQPKLAEQTAKIEGRNAIHLHREKGVLPRMAA